MKVILAAKSVYPFHPFGGVQKYVYNYAKFLLKEGIDVEIVTPLDKRKSRTEIYEGIKYTLLAPSIYWYLEYPIGWFGVHLFSLKLASYLKNVNFDLLHSFDMTGYQYLKHKDRKPVISHIFTDNYLCNPISFWDFFNIFSLFGHKTSNIKKEKITLSPFSGKRMIVKYPLQYFFKIKPIQYCLNHSEGIFFEEDIFRREIIELFHIEANKCYTVLVGTDISFINSKINKNLVSRTDLGLNEDDLVLITVNRLAADKGIDKIILALDDIRRELSNIKLIIIGSGYQEKELLKLIAEKNLGDNICHFKNVSEDKLYKIYKISDIYISAFSFPGSSISTLEAMACSLPVITTAQPWLIIDNENGIVLEKNEPELIRDAVIRLAKENKLKLKGETSNQIVQKYNWKAIVQVAKRKYEQILFPQEGNKEIRKFSIAGVKVSAINMDDACLALESIVQNKRQGYVCVCPASTIVECNRNETVRDAVNSAYLVTPDGMPLVWMGKIKGFRNMSRVYGPDLMPKFLGLAEKRGYSNFFYGSENRVLEKLRDNLRRRFPDLKIAGEYSPPFRPLTPEEDKKNIDMINRSSPDIVWVAIGNPKQEIWMAEHLGKINASVMIGVGAAFDFLSGNKKQAPRWMRDSGFEWLFRLVTEPKRLWKRYLIGNSIFLWLFLKEFVKIKILRKKSDYD